MPVKGLLQFCYPVILSNTLSVYIRLRPRLPAFAAGAASAEQARRTSLSVSVDKSAIAYLLLPLAAYSFGAVPFGLILCMVFRGVDIREHGSRNIGATNAGRVCGWPFFAATFLLDFAKGLAPVVLGAMVVQSLAPELAADWLWILYGALAIAGHTFPAYCEFKGGKAVATGFGVFMALAPVAAAIAFGVWLVLFVAFRYVSLASICAAAAAPIAYAMQHRDTLDTHRPILYFASAVAVLVIVRHHANIRRLISGTENRFRQERKSDADKELDADRRR